MKKTLSLLLVLVMLCSTFAGLQITSHALSSSGSCGDNVTYSFDSSTGTLTIRGSGAMTNYTFSVKPDSYSSNSPFSNQTGIKTVVIETGVTSIGNHAFYSCSKITSITIPDSVTTIGVGTFKDCSGLTSIIIPDSVINIGDSAFSNCIRLTSITIGNSVKSISHSAFWSCSNLTSITIPNSVKSISNFAFYRCSRLTSITIPDSVTSIGSSAFSDCSGLTSVTIPNSITSIGLGTFRNCSGLEELTMPCSAKIYNSSDTFYNCENIEKVTLTKGTGTMQNYGTSTSSSATETYYQYTPWYISRDNLKELVLEEGITKIGNYSFFGCSKLLSITIPDSVISIGSHAYSGCSRLITVIISDSVTNIGYCAFEDCSGLKNLTMPCSAKIYNSETTFKNCKNIEKVTLTKGTGVMKNYASSISSTDTCFRYTPWYISRSKLKELVIEDGLSSIGSYAFSYCDKLTSITIPDSVTSIGNYAFENCSRLTSITIPNSATSIGDGAFYRCSGLTSITIPNSVTNIGDSAFSGCSGLTSISIPDSITIIGSSAFSGCSRLTSVTIPEPVTNIGEAAFQNCIGLKEITMPASAKIYNSEYTFKNCTNIEKVTLTKGTGEMQNYGTSSSSEKETYYQYTPWYISCDSVKELVLEEGITNIGTNAFSGCIRLISISIPNSVTSIGGSAFSGCSGLTNIIIPDTVTNIGDSAFSGCGSLTSITIPNSVTSIGSSAFFGCSGLTNIIIPNTITSIDSSTFSGCSGLTNITIPNTVTSIDSSAFFDCNGLTSITIPDSVTSIGNSAFSGCNSLIMINYTGTKSQWEGINIASDNNTIKTATIQYHWGEEHEFLTVVTNPTCTQKGFTTHTCKNCNYQYIDEYKTELGHKYQSIVTKPTCTKQGYTTHICSVCGNIDYRNNYTKALGHDFSTKTTKATLKANGKIVATCKRCKGSKTTVIYHPENIIFSPLTFVYNAKVQKPKVKVTGNDGKAIAGKFYTVTYSKGCKNVGQYTVKISFKGYYSGSLTKTFQILPAPVKKASAAPYSQTAIKVSWNKVAGIGGYSIYRYNNKTKKWQHYKNTTSTSIVVPRFSEKDTDVSVRIHTYKKVGAKTYYNVGSQTKYICEYTKPSQPRVALKNTDFGEFKVIFNRYAGHQIQISDNISFSNKGNNVCKTFRYYSSNELFYAASTKTYYVRAREYFYTNNNKLVVGPWSAVKSITTY